MAIRFSANLSFLFADRAWPDRITAAADAGFAAIEVNPPFPYVESPAAFAAALDARNLTCPLIVAPLGEGDCALGHACVPGAEQAFRDSIRRAIDYAIAGSVPLIHPSSGRLPEGVSRAEGEAVYVGNLAWAAQCVTDAGLRLCVEPVCEMRTPGFFVQTPDQARALIAQTGHSDIGLVFDVFHVETQVGDAIGRLKAAFADVVHIQISDTPNRHVPGTGRIDFPALFGLLESSGYTGWVGCEYQTQDAAADLAWAAPWSHVPLGEDPLKAPKSAPIQGE